MVLTEMGVNTRNWVDSVQHRGYWRALVNAALDLQNISHGVITMDRTEGENLLASPS